MEALQCGSRQWVLARPLGVKHHNAIITELTLLPLSGDCASVSL
jgi:hypothetical protein